MESGVFSNQVLSKIAKDHGLDNYLGEIQQEDTTKINEVYEKILSFRDGISPNLNEVTRKALYKQKYLQDIANLYYRSNILVDGKTPTHLYDICGKDGFIATSFLANTYNTYARVYDRTIQRPYEYFKQEYGQRIKKMEGSLSRWSLANQSNTVTSWIGRGVCGNAFNTTIKKLQNIPKKPHRITLIPCCHEKSDQSTYLDTNILKIIQKKMNDKQNLKETNLIIDLFRTKYISETLGFNSKVYQIEQECQKCNEIHYNKNNIISISPYSTDA